MTLATLVGVVVLFHGALMQDTSNVRELMLGGHPAPSEHELSRFIYVDGIAGGLNHLWIGPLLGVAVGGVGALLGKLGRVADDNRS